MKSSGYNSGFGKFYRNYIDGMNFNSDHVGNAWSIAVRSAKAYDSEFKILRGAPLYPLCHRDCFSLRMSHGYNKREIPHALLARAVKVIKPFFPGCHD
jgi:hypothetical protein